MKAFRLWASGTVLVAVLGGLPYAALAKQHSLRLPGEPTESERVKCVVSGVIRMFGSDAACRDFGGTVLTEAAPNAETPDKKIQVKKIAD